MSMVQQALIATAPTRLDFGGGWTDVPPYPEERGGFVCNIAINRLATVRLTPTMDAADAPLPVESLTRAALARAGLTHVRVELSSDFPVGAGLGGSSAAGVALAAAIHAYQHLHRSPAELAEWSRAVEVDLLGIAGGRQDHYAAAFGGALGLTFGTETQVAPIPLDDAMINALEQQCLLLFTGESRISATTITAVLDAYCAREPKVVNALSRMAELARDMQVALTNGNIEALASYVDEHWTHQRALHSAITTNRIDAIEAHARAAGAWGMKALGASGGGCMIVLAPSERVDAVMRAVTPFAELLPWRIAHHGVAVHTDEY